LELTYLQTFREVARWGSYTLAAKKLGYAQSSITTQIQKLEDRHDYPEMNVIIQPANEPFIIESVKAGSLDVGFILDPPFSDPELHCQVLREEELLIVAHTGHRFSTLSQVKIEDLHNESFILTEDGCTYRAMLLKALKEGEVNCKLSYEFGNLEAIKQCVIFGLGIALLPRIVVAEEIRKGKMVAATFAHPAFRFYTQMIYAKKKWVSKAFNHFLELTTACRCAGGYSTPLFKQAFCGNRRRRRTSRHGKRSRQLCIN
jgi:DNA-binding transcriptional LysR family regulator